jgi:UDP-glucuronate 4-epimerase
MKVLVTGSAGFIGFHLVIALLDKAYEVVGLDNINDYYDVQLKYDRLSESGIDPTEIEWNKEVRSKTFAGYTFVKMNLEDKTAVMALFEAHHFDVVVNLAAQAGVRYSISKPDLYIQSNVVGFLNILEACRYHFISHLVYASSSSVYGLNQQIPFSVTQNVDHPISIYAATKKANELMAHTYSHLYRIPTTGLRFFAVYGPWGRPDMACFLFTDAIINGHPIELFNSGNMMRDFTYIDDVVKGVLNVIDKPANPVVGWSNVTSDPSTSSAPYRIYNIGNNSPVKLKAFVREIEKNCGKKASIKMMNLQPGDVSVTWADVDDLVQQFNYKPATAIQSGIKKYVSWHLSYYSVRDLSMSTVETGRVSA